MSKKLYLIMLVIGIGITVMNTTRSYGETTQPEKFSSYLMGRHAQHIYDYRNAAHFMRQVWAHNPDIPLLTSQTFKVLLASGAYEEVIRLAHIQYERSVTTPLIVITLTAHSIMNNEKESAKRYIDALSSSGIFLFLRHLYFAWHFNDTPQREQAIEEIELFNQQLSSSLIAFHIGLLDLAAENYDNATHYLSTALESGSPRIVYSIARFMRKNNHHDAADRLVQHYLTESQSHTNTPSFSVEDSKLMNVSILDGYAEALFDMARIVDYSLPEHALLYSRLAVMMQPELTVAQEKIINFLSSRNYYTEALMLLESLSTDPDLGWSAKLHIARILYAMDRQEEAIQKLEEMIKQRPLDIDTVVQLADFMRQREQFDQAIKIYTRAIEQLGPDNHHSKYWYLYYQRAITYDMIDNWPAAEKDLHISLELNPDQPDVLNYLGYTWADRNIHLSKAHDMLKLATDQSPNNAYILDSIGWVLYRLGNLDGAIQKLEYALTFLPFEPIINDHLGDVYWEVGRYFEAQFQWQRALDHLTDDPELAENLRTKLMRELRYDNLTP